MEETFNRLLAKLETLFDKFVAEFETAPVKTVLKVVVIVYAIKWIRRNLR